MTTFIPSITLPYVVFANPAASVLLPIALGTAVGYSSRREGHPLESSPEDILTGCHPASDTQRTYMALKQPPLKPSPRAFGPVWTALYG